MNQKVMKLSFRRAGEVNTGDVLQCPFCRKKFVVLPGTVQFKIGGSADVFCPNCAQATPESYYQEMSADPVELPTKRRRRKEDGD